MATLPLFIYRSCLSILSPSPGSTWLCLKRSQAYRARTGRHRMALCRLCWNQSLVSPAELEIICSKGIAEIQNTDSSRGLSTNSSLDTSSQIIPTDLSFITQMDPLSSCSLSSALVALLIILYIINPDWLFFIWASPSLVSMHLKMFNDVITLFVSWYSIIQL